MKVEIVSIDAWREAEGGWTWNQSFRLPDPPPEVAAELDRIAWDATRSPKVARRFLALLREHGYLGAGSAGSVRLDNCGSCDPCMVEVQARGTGEPLIALMLGRGDAP